MRTIRTIGLVVGALLALAIPSSGQVVQNQVTGNEVWVAGQGPGGPGNFLNIGGVSNRAAIALVSGSGAATTTMTQAQSTLMWTGAAPTTWAVTLPSPAYDGQIVTLGTDTTLTTMVTVTAGSGQTLSATYNSQTLTAVTSVEFQYTNATTKWFRLR
jgi:hypothetical protein